MLDSEQTLAKRFVSVCPLCKERYELDEASVLEGNDAMYLLYKQCRQCQSSIVVALFHTNQGVSSAGIVTDLTQDDIDRLRNRANLTSDEVLELCQTIYKQTGK